VAVAVTPTQLSACPRLPLDSICGCCLTEAVHNSALHREVAHRIGLHTPSNIRVQTSPSKAQDAHAGVHARDEERNLDHFLVVRVLASHLRQHAEQQARLTIMQRAACLCHSSLASEIDRDKHSQLARIHNVENTKESRRTAWT
jgi:hypothetical protein